jgi:hypothetical protein
MDQKEIWILRDPSVPCNAHTSFLEMEEQTNTFMSASAEMHFAKIMLIMLKN